MSDGVTVVAPTAAEALRAKGYLAYRDPDGVSTLFSLAIERARADADSANKAEVAERVRAAVEGSGLTNAQFADLVGTSASRLSTYLSVGRSPPRR